MGGYKAGVGEMVDMRKELVAMVDMSKELVGWWI